MKVAPDDDNPLPPAAYVPGGPWARPPRRLNGGAPGELLREGIALFDAGFYWEAHEVWEVLWHQLGRIGPEADAVKGLIKLTAACVKVRQRQPRGVVTHARRAAALFRGVRAVSDLSPFGLDLAGLSARADSLAGCPPPDPDPPGVPVVRVVPWKLPSGADGGQASPEPPRDVP